MEKANFNLPPKSTASSARAVLLEEAMAFVGWELTDKRSLGRMLRGFKGKRPSDIYRMMSVARQEGRNPPALFLHLMGMAKGTTTAKERRAA